MDERDRAEEAEDKKPEAPAAPKTPPESRIRKILRVVVYAVFVASVAGALLIQCAYGRMKDNALEIGDELDKLGDVGNKTPILLNGQRIHVASSVHAMSVSETLDRAELLCERGDPSSLGQEPELPLDSASAKLETHGSGGRGMVRQERDGRGVVLCFAPPEGEPNDDGIRARFKRFMTFMATGELEAMGHLRYLYAKATQDGGTHLIRVWTDGPFNLYAMSREPGQDAPGTDPNDVPRPPDSARLLSATVEVAPYAVRIYESQQTAPDVAASYDKKMPELGWKLLIRDGDARVYQRKDITVFVTPAEQEGKVLVSMLHMGSE